MDELPIDFRVLRVQEVCDKTGLSKATIDRLEADGKFPQRIRLSEAATGWFLHELIDWMANLPRVPMAR